MTNDEFIEIENQQATYEELSTEEIVALVKNESNEEELDDDHSGSDEAKKVSHEDALIALNNFIAPYLESLGEEKYGKFKNFTCLN